MKTFAPGIASTLAILLLSGVCSHNAVRAQVKQPKPGVTLSPVEQELLDEINLLRTRPSVYASFLEGLKPFFKGANFERPGKVMMITQEGWEAVDEAIRFLRATKPLEPLGVSGGMCRGAGEHVQDQKKSGATGHKGTDGSFCEDRVARFGAWAAPIGENLSYGDDSARERVLNFLIDDGVSNRNHRKRLLDASFKVAGVSCGEHTTLGSLCVVTLAGGFTEKLNAARPANVPNRKGTARPHPTGVRRH